VAFQGLLSGTIANEQYLKATLSVELYTQGTPSNGIYLLGTPALNELETIDVYDYFRTEDNLHFLVTEDSNYLVI